MTPERYAEIKKKYTGLKEQVTRAEGAQEQILASLLADYKITSVDMLEEEIKKLEQEQKFLEEELDQLGKELEAVTNWEEV